MKLLAFITVIVLSTMATANEKITPLQLGQATLEAVKSLTRKEKITADKIQVLSLNPDFVDASSNEELLEIKLSFVSSAGPVKEARFICHAVEHSVYESALPHCHRAQ